MIELLQASRMMFMLFRFLVCLVLATFPVVSALAADRPQSRPSTQPTTRPVEQAGDGKILLHAKDVTVHGTTVRYEPQPNKNTIGYWTNKDDWVSWDFVVKKPGKFRLVILQGCGKGSGGSEVAFRFGKQSLKTTVQETGGFQNFVSRDLGTLELPEGRHTLEVKPITKPGLAVMDLRSVTLEPAGEEKSAAAPASQ
jgi:arylsulfatase A